MAAKNTQLIGVISCFVQTYPGLNRGRIAAGLQRSGVSLGKQHIQNTVSEMVNKGQLTEHETPDGRRIIFPPAHLAPAAAKT